MDACRLFPDLKKTALVTLLSLILIGWTNAQDCNFVRQSVNMKIEKRHMFVSGMYFIQGAPNSSHEIVFPFPNGSYYGKIDSIHAYDVNRDKEIIPDRITSREMEITVVFDSTDMSLLQVYYRLTLLGNRAKYPFSTNASKENVLEKACFYLIAPSSMELEQSSYELNEFISGGENSVYIWEMHHFTPVDDLELRFRNMDE